jgi:DNA-binding NarL/FixJ family response regulator
MRRPSFAETRVLIVDDHPFMRRGLAQTINDQAGLEVCGEAGSVAEALQLMETCNPHLAVVDISLGAESGIELIQALRERWPAVRVLVSSMHDETQCRARPVPARAVM